MPQARGSQTTIAVFEETTYNVVPGTPAGYRIPITSSSLNANQNNIDSETLTADRARYKPGRGNIDVNGALSCELSATSLGVLFHHAFGAVAHSGADPYTHDYSIAALPVGLHVEQDYGAAISGEGRYEQFGGCRVNQMTMNFPLEGFVTVEFGLMGASQLLADTPLDVTLTENPFEPFTSFEAQLTEGGVQACRVISAQVTLDNGLDGSTYCLGGAGERAELPEGMATVSGTLVALFNDPALLKKAVDGTETDLIIQLQRGDGLGSAGNESMVLDVQQLLFDRTSPPIQGPQGIQISLDFRGYRSGADLGLTLQVNNAIATF